VGLVWAGDGEFEVTDPGPEAARLLHERLETLPGIVPLEVALLVASDGAVAEILADAGAWQEGTVPIPVRAIVQARIAAFDPIHGKAWRPPGGLMYSPDPAQGGIFMDLRSPDLRRDPREILAGRLPINWIAYRWSWYGGQKTLDHGSIAVRSVGKDVGERFATLPPPKSGMPELPGLHRGFDLVDVTVHAKFVPTTGLDRDLSDVELVAHLELDALEHATANVDLQLLEGVNRVLGEQWAELRVKGVHLDGASVPFDRVVDQLYVRLPEAPAAGTRVSVDVIYEGAIVEPVGQGSIRPLLNGWYPVHWPADRHTLTTTVTFPKFWKLAATGRRVEELEDGPMRTVTSRCDRPVERGVLYLFDGRLQQTPPPSEGLPTVRIVRAPDTHGAATKFADEIFTYLTALTEVLGPFPYDELEIIERRVHGPFHATPGVISVAIFDSPPDVVLTTDVGRHSLIQALVRQYLEADMGAWSHSEQWIIEGLAALSECWALDRTGHQGRCLANVKQMRELWTNHMASSGEVWLIGPLSQGAYAGVPSVGLFTEPNSQLRGPLVMHRLRLLLGERATWVMLQRIAATYRGQRLRASSFQLQAQAVAIADLEPFFVGWVQQTPQEPVARATWRGVLEDDGTWTLHVRGWIDSGRTGDPLPIIAPFLVRLELGKNDAWQKIVLTEQPTDLQIRGIPVEPKKIRLDDLTWPGKVDVKREKQ
jgi:hypothetical protein